jgi:hypothetical protein
MSSDHHTRGPARLLITILGLLAATALIAAGCGGDDEGSEISTQEITGDAVEGSGYAYALPDGWSIEQESSGTETGVDTVIISDDAGGDFRVNIYDVRESDVPDDTEISTYVDAGIAQVQDDPAGFGLPADATVDVVSEPADTELGGEPALDYEVLTKGEGIAASQRQIASIHEGTAYTITLSAGEGDLEANNAVLDDIVSSWSWS